ncbi:rhomboid family intramembrane serine protease [Roseibium salinum]|nr:rhomboid family intramembrane serine protease [Roseibium salinum]
MAGRCTSFSTCSGWPFSAARWRADLGAGRFLLFSVLCSIGGALAHLATHWGETAPMIGASAAISGQMAAAIRFVFELGGPLGAIRRSDRAAYLVPAQPLSVCFRNQQVLVFVAVWFGLNLFFWNHERSGGR